MPRRVQNDSVDTRDWTTRASEQLATAQGMEAGPGRDEAIRKAEQFRAAAEMAGFLRTSDAKPER